MKAGPVRDSPSKFQRWIYEMEPGHSAPILAGLVASLMLIPAVLANPGILSSIHVLGLFVFVFSWIVIHFRGSNRHLSKEERLDEVVPYWPSPHVPVLKERSLLIYPAAGVAAAMFTLTRTFIEMADDGFNVRHVGLVGIQIAVIVFFVAMLGKSVRARRDVSLSDE